MTESCLLVLLPSLGRLLTERGHNSFSVTSALIQSILHGAETCGLALPQARSTTHTANNARWTRGLTECTSGCCTACNCCDTGQSRTANSFKSAIASAMRAAAICTSWPTTASQLRGHPCSWTSRARWKCLFAVCLYGTTGGWAWRFLAPAPCSAALARWAITHAEPRAQGQARRHQAAHAHATSHQKLKNVAN